MNRAASTSNHKLTSLISPLAAGLLFMALLFAGCGGDNNSSPPKPTATPTPTINVSLWVANGTNVLEFAPSQLLIQGATSPVPQLTLANPAFGSPQGVTFDAAGDLWVIDGGTLGSGGTVPPGLDEFTPAQLVASKNNGFPSSGPVTGLSPNVTINSPGFFTFPQQAAFDSKGDLWVSDNGSNAVFEFTPAQLAASNSNVTPNVGFISSPAFSGPLGITFDSAGNLWVANNASTTIFEFNAASLPTGTLSLTGLLSGPVLTPNIVLADDGNGSIQGPWALAFDSSGNLWSSNASTPFTIVEFAKSSLIPLPPGLNASVVPAVTIDPMQAAGLPSLNSPNGIAFDNLGDLAAANSLAPFSIALFQNPQLIINARFDAHYTSFGPTGVPNVFFSGAATTLNAPAGVTFGPVH